jgi:hypothetical protein
MLDHMRLYTAKGEMLYIYIYIYMHAGIPQKMLDHMRLYRKRCMEMLIYIYIYIMTACGYTAKDGPLNVCDI